MAYQGPYPYAYYPWSQPGSYQYPSHNIPAQPARSDAQLVLGTGYGPTNSPHSAMQGQAEAVDEGSGTKQHFGYSVRIIDPHKKSKWMVRMWHDATEEFDSPTTLKARLVESFPEELSDTLRFQVGYFKNNAKRWIVESRDLVKMYSAFKKGSEILLWCEGKESTTTTTEPEEKEPPAKRAKTGCTRRELFETEVDEIFKKLKDKHPQMAAPKIRLWARLIQSGRCDDYDTPPNIPLITGAPVGAKPKESMKDVITGAATAVVKMLQSNGSSDPSTPSSAASGPTSTYISPLKTAQLRRSCLDDLKKIKELHEDGVLTEVEYLEEKKSILNSLKTLK